MSQSSQQVAEAGGGTRLSRVAEAAQAVTEKRKFKGNLRAVLHVGRIKGH